MPDQVWKFSKRTCLLLAAVGIYMLVDAFYAINVGLPHQDWHTFVEPGISAFLIMMAWYGWPRRW